MKPFTFSSKTTTTALGIVLLGLLSSGCDEKEIDEMVSLKFDPAVSPALQSTVKRDIRSMANFNFRLGGATDPFRLVFGEDGSKSVVRYLDDRVNYVVGPDTPIGQLIESSAARAALPFSLHDFPAHVKEIDSGAPTIKAENIGLNLWLMQEAARPLHLSFRLDDTIIPINSPRIGLFRLYPHYLTDFFIENISILIHEARHSDCTGALLQKC